MFVNQIRGRHLRNVDGSTTSQIDNPDWATIERAIRDLGRNTLGLELRRIPSPAKQEPTEARAEHFMGIGGGARDSYSIFVYFPNGSVQTLNVGSDQLPADDQHLDELPHATLSDAIKVARIFAFEGQLDATFTWLKSLSK